MNRIRDNLGSERPSVLVDVELLPSTQAYTSVDDLGKKQMVGSPP